MKYISKVGVEIEGGWDYQPPAEIYHDGSVTASGSVASGEACSPPSSLCQSLTWLRKNYPSQVDSSCGLHIHVSLKSNLYYSRLMNREFYDFFLTRAEAWGREKEILPESPFWYRLAGENRYCRKAFQPDAQSSLSYKDSIRYTHLNYCFSIHKTLECRLFPAFKKVEVSCSAVRMFVRCVEDWLSTQKGREKAICIEVSDVDTSIEKITMKVSDLDTSMEKILIEEVIE